MADPGDGDLTEAEFGKSWTLGLAGAPCQQGLPDHLPKKRARVKVLRRRKVLEGARERLTALRRTIRGVFRHISLLILSILRFE